MQLVRSLIKAGWWHAAIVNLLNGDVRSDPPEQKILGLDAGYKAAFESPEHQLIGDSVHLTYPNVSVSGLNFAYDVENTSLSFGSIVSLAGDFYYHWHPTYCAEAISDYWGENATRSIEIAKDNANLLRTDSPGILDCVLPLIEEQRNVTANASPTGRDPAQVYNDNASHYNTKFGRCTLGYLAIAICNRDHFGADATIAYRALHIAALEEATSADSISALREAYFLEAYAQHFLTDAFSAGHIRTPRRSLHSTSPLCSTCWFDLWPADQSARNQHDEDSANGLWVTNALGQSWAAYGDMQLLDGRSAKNRQYAIESCQSGVDEIWQAFQTRQSQVPSHFAALQKVPIPESASGVGNFVALFENDPEDGDSVLFRDNLIQRASTDERRRVAMTQSNYEWDTLTKMFANSGPSLNMFIFTRAFNSATRFIHLGAFGTAAGTILASAYGNLDSGNLGEWWSMQSASSFAFPREDESITWVNAEHIGNDVVSLVARSATDTNESLAHHVGLRVVHCHSGRMTIETLWRVTTHDSNSHYESGQILYDRFDTYSTTLCMVKYLGFKGKSSKIELWSLPETQEMTLSRLDTQAEVMQLNFLLSHKVNQGDAFSTIVGFGANHTMGYWSFMHWKNNFTEKVQSQIIEPNAFKAQAILADSDFGRLVRLNYGSWYPVTAKIRIDIVRPVRDSATNKVSFLSPQQSLVFDITWPAFLEKDYLLWFLADVDGDGNKDLVAYTSLENNIILHVIVFPGLSNGGFANAVISPITLDPDIGYLMTAEFMRPMRTVQASYTYPEDISTTDAGIISFFDNYGIVGGRMIAPKRARGTFEYEFKGQNPSIAGQRSTSLGWKPGNWMGLDRREETIGLFVFPDLA